MEKTRLQKQLAFLLEIDKMKTILGSNVILDKSKQEDDAEHSWHMAVMAMLLYEYAPKGTDLLRVLKMALIHDLVEVYAGDTFCYDKTANQDKVRREQAAADKLFSMLEKDQEQELRTLWEEFDRMDTPDSLYAGACLLYYSDSAADKPWLDIGGLGFSINKHNQCVIRT